MGGNVRLSDKIVFGVITLFFGYIGLVAAFTNFPWGLCCSGIIFLVWSLVIRAYTWTVIEERGVELVSSGQSQAEEEAEAVPFNDPRWIIDPSPDSEQPGRILSAPQGRVNESRIILGPTPAGGEVVEPARQKQNREREEDRELADMFRAL